jgi:hypothetical protein
MKDEKLGTAAKILEFVWEGNQEGGVQEGKEGCEIQQSNKCIFAYVSFILPSEC